MAKNAARWGACIQVGHTYSDHEETGHCLVFVEKEHPHDYGYYEEN